MFRSHVLTYSRAKQKLAFLPNDDSIDLWIEKLETVFQWKWWPVPVCLCFQSSIHACPPPPCLQLTCCPPYSPPSYRSWFIFQMLVSCLLPYSKSHLPHLRGHQVSALAGDTLTSHTPHLYPSTAWAELVPPLGGCRGDPKPWCRDGKYLMGVGQVTSVSKEVSSCLEVSGYINFCKIFWS